MAVFSFLAFSHGDNQHMVSELKNLKHTNVYPAKGHPMAVVIVEDTQNDAKKVQQRLEACQSVSALALVSGFDDVRAMEV